MSTTREDREFLSPAVAVVGVSALFPGSTEVRGFWRDIMQGRDQIREVPPQYWLIDDYYDPDPAAPDKTYGKRGAFLDATPFDALAYGVPPNVVQQTDTSQLLGLIVAQKVLEDAAGGDFAHIDKSCISVILGATGTTELVVHLGARLQRPIWLDALRRSGIPEDEAQAVCNRIAASYVPWTEASFPGLLGNVVAGRIANKFDLGGTNCVVDAACASSLSALAMGLSELYLHQSDLVIAGGVDTLNDILMYMCFSKTPALSPSGDCRPFSDQADGTILGEGLGMVALRRLEDAERDGDHIYAVIRGLGSSSDGKGTAVYAPKASGQAQALRRAYAAAGYSPRTVELLEAHGTATRAGDAAEFEGAGSVFAEADSETKQWCAIGSIKSQIGHTKGAAGAAALIKAVLALHHKALPPTIKVERPNPSLNVAASPFYINTQARPWVRDGLHPRRASVSSFGFGGSNFHVTLEEYSGSGGRKDRFRPSPSELFVLSAGSSTALLAAAAQMTQGFDAAEDFQFLARATQRAFVPAQPLRLALVAKEIADLRAKLAVAVAAIQADPSAAQRSPAGWHYSGGSNNAQAEIGKVAFLFPGQGSQYVGMGSDLALAFPAGQEVWDRAAELEFDQGGRLQEVVFPQPVFDEDERHAQENRLRSTDWAQPAIGVASLSQLALLAQLGLQPDVLGGHSFGEVTALYAAGALDQKSFLHVARKRGELMAEAAEMFPGAMIAVTHPTAQLAELLASWDTGVVLANHNTPDQVVISGVEAAVAACEERLQQAGIRCQRLPVATAFHSPVVRPAAAPFHAYLNHVPIHPARLPVYANSTAALYSAVPEAVRETLAEQIALPVLFSEQIEAMYAAGVRIFVEVGPSAVLTNLVKSCLGQRPHQAVALDRKGEHGLTSLWQALAQLAAAGVAFDLSALWEGVAAGEGPQARRVPKLAVPLSGVNYNKPYPPAGGSAGLAAPNPPRRAAAAVPAAAPANGSAAGPRPQPNAHPSMIQLAHQPAKQPVNQPMNPSTSQSTNQPASQPVNQPAANQQPAAPVADPAPSNGHVMPAARPPAPPAPVQTMPVQTMSPPAASQLAPIQPAAIQPAPGLENGEALAWAGLFQELQRQTADAHMAFLQVAEQSLRGLETMLSLSVAGARPPAAPHATAVAALPAPAAYIQPQPVAAPAQPSAPATAVLPPAPPMEVAPASVAAPVPAAPVYAAPVHAAPAVAPALPAAPPVPAAPAAPVAAGSDHDLHGQLMAVVTEKTGYPTEMLEPGMALDTDLGIDSIKRVEILAAMRERVPALPEFDTAVMAGLRTLGEIVAYMDSQLGGQGAAAQAAPVVPAAQAVPMPAAASAGQQHDLHGQLMAVVTEKTGYPTEMLEPGMALDTDLGIDSIKRVEILAAMRERVPALPEFDTAVMAGLRTLGEIVAYMDSQLGGQGAAAAQAVPMPAAAPAGQQHDLHGQLMAVVTEKTGYPTEMLEPGMALDTDLGIDSIKRVEILAAMRERVPALPEFDTAVMAGLRTLGEIVAYMDSQLGGQGAAAQVAPAPSLQAASAQPAHAALGRYTLQPRTAAPPGLAPLFLIDGTPVYITDDGHGVAAALAVHLQAAGADPVVCTAPPADARAVVCLAGLVLSGPDGAQENGASENNANSAGEAARETALAANAAAFAAAATVAAAFEAHGGLFVTVQDTGGDFGLRTDPGSRAWLGGLSALAKTAAQEWPLAVVRAIDLAADGQSAAASAARLAAELLHGGADLEIGLPPSGERLALALVETPAQPGAPGSKPVVDEQSLLVVSGGGRGVTAASLIALAQAARPRIALLGRTPLEAEPPALAGSHDDAALKKALLAAAQAQGQRLSPKELGAAAARIQAGREIRATLAALAAAGAQAMYVACDVSDAGDTARALETVRAQWGPITGFVHGAGVLADKRLAEKTRQDFAYVFGAKVAGLRSLLAATQHDPLRLICLFSSVAGRMGNAGQADYAMANELLNRVAESEARRRPTCVVKSIGWGPWAGGMVTPLLKAKFDELGVALIPQAAGAAAFVAELQAPRHEVEVVIGGLPQAAPLLPSGRAQGERPFIFDVAVSAATHPYLADHQVNGVVVLPLVLVQEWFLRAALLHGDSLPGGGGPGLTLQKLRVHKGLPLPDFAARPTRLRLEREAPAPGSAPGPVRLLLRDAQGVLRFSAEVAEARLQPPSAPALLTGAPVDRSGAPLYGGQLFHGPRFAAIQRVDQLDTGGAAALLAGSELLGWPDEGWLSDPALLDGALQLARVWGYAGLGHLTLPTACARLTVWRRGLLGQETVRCQVRGATIGQSGTRSDLWLWDERTGELLAEIEGLEMYLSSEPALVGEAR